MKEEEASTNRSPKKTVWESRFGGSQWQWQGREAKLEPIARATILDPEVDHHILIADQPAGLGFESFHGFRHEPEWWTNKREKSTTPGGGAESSRCVM